MNYRDYMEIMESEGLSLPAVAEYTTENAKRCQNIIKKLKKETDFDMAKQIKQLEEEKIYWILEAIDWARLAKGNPDGFEWAGRRLNRKEHRKGRGRWKQSL